MSDSRLPPIFKPAHWRGTTTCCPVERATGVSITLEDGTHLRLRMQVDSARKMAQSILSVIQALEASQSDKSSLSPSVPGLPQEGH